MKISRRVFLTGSGALLTAASLPSIASAQSWYDEAQLEKIEVKIPSLPKEFDHYRIGFLTDIHIGRNTPRSLLESALEKVTAEKIDMLLLGGDYIALSESTLSLALEIDRNTDLINKPIDEIPEIVYSTMVDTIKRFRPKDGIFGVFGNHDHWVDPALCVRHFTDAKIPILVNQTQSIVRGESKLQIYGTDDYWNGTPGAPKWSKVGKNEARILLSHNPDYSSILARHGGERYFDLALGGHTHGGQIKLPLIGAIMHNIKDLRLAEGLFVDPTGCAFYTSRGIGVVELPWRLNCPPEATVLTLIAA